MLASDTRFQQVAGMHFAGNASQKLVEAAQSHASSLTVIATGPLTNIAHALQLDPQLVSKGMLTDHASPK